MTREKSNVLYGEGERVEYLSVESVKEILIGMEAFYAHKGSFKKDGRNADVVLDYIERVRNLIPNEIRGILPDHFELSNKALGKLEEKCKEAVKKKVLA